MEKSRISLNLETQQIRELEERAEREDRSLSNIVREALRGYFGQKKVL